MSARKYASCRSTEIDERDVYVCEAKYSLQTKLFRKFTKELKAFKLSTRCLEDEIYVLRRDLQLRKHLSPLLVELNIDYEDQSSDYLRNFNDPSQNDSAIMGEHDETSNHWMKDDDDSSHDEMEMSSMISPQQHNSSMMKHNKVSMMLNDSKENGSSPHISRSSTKIGSKKDRVKREKKSGFNMFSKEFRKSLRDTKSSLSFIEMSKEVGARWRAMSDKERAAYEQKAVIATIREQENRKGENT